MATELLSLIIYPPMVIHYVEPNGSAPSISRRSAPEPAIPKQDIHEHTASESSVTGSSSSKPSTPEQPDAKPAELVTVEAAKVANPEEEEKPVYLPRADRMNQTPTKGNAQGLFLPDCCVFVGNLSIKVSLEKLEEDLTDMISTFGRCHVKIKLSQGLKKLPVAFVQFEDIVAANSALKQNGNLMLHNRVLRLESSRARRTAHFGYLTDKPIDKSVIIDALKGVGSLEGITIESFVNPEGVDSTFGVVTFAYPDDYADALQHFQNHPEYYMTRPAMDPNDNQLPHDYPAPGHRPSNQPPPNRGNGNQQRYNNGRRSFHRPWYSGGNNNRGGFRNAPGAASRHQNTPFANHGHSRSFNGQGHSPHGSFSQNYPGGNGFPHNNFNQGYPNPNYQNFHGNNFPPNYPNPSFVAAGAFPNPPVMFNQIHMHDSPPPPYHTDYTAMPTPGFPVFLGNQSYQPSNPLPPIITQPQPQPVAGPVPGRRRLPPRPDCPLIVSSQPQFDTEHHQQLYYEPYPADETFANMQSSWVGPGICFVQPDYTQPYPPNAYPRSRQSSMASQQHNNSPPRVTESESILVQTKVQTPETERGRQLVRPRHPNTDGGSDMAPVSAPAKTQSEPISIQALDGSQERIDMIGASKSTDTQSGAGALMKEPIESQNKPTGPDNEPNQPQTESACDPTHNEKKDEMMDETESSLIIDTKNEESGGSSSEAGPKTPDTDESREGAKLQTPAQADSLKFADTKTPDTTETLKPVDKSTPNKSKPSEMTTATPTKTGSRRLEPAVPDNKHLLARHAFQHRKPLKKKYQPKTDTGKTVEQYTREINAQRASVNPDSRVPEHLLQEVIQELENERRGDIRKSRGLGPSDKSSVDSGTSKK
ncbi:Nucleotide-binding alpha-beta plait [Penicillium cf. griseofulvum]|uniref:Nucleotide-binding alpha-beta plait n=1 Tax=Penicillium cf. griseofulvum TaxID=2972120 RepID=A0A9W9MZE3_9EURO|nr:Nucleotide-binding alpha-beta plait [Penicillium cf. griseofulvum]KAJ5421765.1 Nucleotide-binding alpha-beta plait [Penicillium cf. griseofulvum]KAJ5427957.1 Nucleotide-binding alpha-beta plait [Penicillium cf. griseofulvum]